MMTADIGAADQGLRRLYVNLGTPDTIHIAAS